MAYDDTTYGWDWSPDDHDSDAYLAPERTAELTGHIGGAGQLWDLGQKIDRIGRIEAGERAPTDDDDDDAEFHDDIVPREMYYRSPDYDELTAGLYDSPLCKADREKRWRRGNLLQDPGKDKIRCRKRAKTDNRIQFEQNRYIDQKLASEGLSEPSDERELRRLELEESRDDRALNGVLVALIMELTGKGRTWAYENLLEFKENGIENTLKSKSITPRRWFDEGEALAGPRECVRAYQSAFGPLPVREPVDERDTIIQPPIDKAAVRAKLEADTAAFLANGGTITKCDDWYPPDEHCITLGGKKHIRPLPFDRWGK